MKNPLFNLKSVIKGSYKAIVGAGAEIFFKSEPEPKLFESWSPEPPSPLVVGKVD